MVEMLLESGSIFERAKACQTSARWYSARVFDRIHLTEATGAEPRHGVSTHEARDSRHLAAGRRRAPPDVVRCTARRTTE